VNNSGVDAGNGQMNNGDSLCKGGCHLSAFLRLDSKSASGLYLDLDWLSRVLVLSCETSASRIL